MPHALTDSLLLPAATPGRPLTGVTVLLVEDSRYASDAVRLLCRKSGARIRRADSIATARRHLRVYYPTVAVIDLGLPDGCGTDLIAELSSAQPRIPVLLGSSGDDSAVARAMWAGADGFLAKPIPNLNIFQQLILNKLPDRPQHDVAILGGELPVEPDRLALRDDMVLAAELLSEAEDGDGLAYATQFLTGVARASHDLTLEHAARRLARNVQEGTPSPGMLTKVSAMIGTRIDTGRVV